jgi:hypothetical protein
MAIPFFAEVRDAEKPQITGPRIIGKRAAA